MNRRLFARLVGGLAAAAIFGETFLPGVKRGSATMQVLGNTDPAQDEPFLYTFEIVSRPVCPQARTITGKWTMETEFLHDGSPVASALAEELPSDFLERWRREIAQQAQEGMIGLTSTLLSDVVHAKVRCES